MRFWFSLLVALSFSFHLWAQSGHQRFSKLDIYGGLSHNGVNTFLTDSKGFLWVGTMSGLNRYDGYGCKVFKHRPGDSTSISDNYIGGIFELPNNKMWVVTRSVPCIYDPVTEQFTKATGYLRSLGMPEDSLAIIVKGRSHFWFVYNGSGLYAYAPKTGRPNRIAPSVLDGAGKITAVKEAPDGNLWVVYQNGLLQKLASSTGKVLWSTNPTANRIRGLYEYRIFADSDGALWVWTANVPNGLHYYDSATDRSITFNESAGPARLNAALITEVIQDKGGAIWVGTDHGGINVIDKKRGFATRSFTHDPKDPKSISQNSITALHKDPKGIVWIGTFKQGVNYVNESSARFAHYHHRESSNNSLQYDDVNRFVEDKKGNLWIGTNGGGLIYFNRAESTFTQYLHQPGNTNSIPSNVIVSLCIDHQDKLWIGTYFGGLSVFDGKSFTHYRHNAADESSLSDDRVWEIFEDQDKNLWVGTLSGGLSLMDRKTGTFRHFQSNPGPLQANYISALLQDRRGNLWVGTSLGITVLGKGQPVQYLQSEAPGSLSNNNVICLLEDSGGRIWVGTRDGLSVWNPQTARFQNFTTADGLPDNMVLNIVEDNRRTFWIATPNGLCNLLPKSSGNDLRFAVIDYDESNNLQGREFNENAALKLSTGELVFGGPGGFNLIQPNAIAASATFPEIVFTALQIQNKNIEVGQKVNGRVLLDRALPESKAIQLSHRDNVFSLEFAALHFAHGSREKYAYLLEGFNTGWLYTDGGQRRVTYTNLDPGTYTFKVKVLNSSGLWSPEKSLRIHIAPPFWQTGWAYALYALLAAGLLYLIRRITLERVRMRFEVAQQRREAERVQALDALKTKFFTNVSHEFRTPLSLILSPLDRLITNTADEGQKGQLLLVQRNARRLLNLVNQLLDFRKMEVQEFTLHPALVDVVPFVRDIVSTFSDISDRRKVALHFSSNTDHLQTTLDSDKMEKILFNLLSNAFKYTPAGGIVSVDLRFAEDANNTRPTLQLSVQDSGIGIPQEQQPRIFERFFQVDTAHNAANPGTGIGLSITREFVRLHGGTITVESEPGKGTLFTVVLPVQNRPQPGLQPVIKPQSVVSSEVSVPAEVAPTSRNKGKKGLILLVEDNEDFRFYLKDNLQHKYWVSEAADGKEGWEMAKDLLPDLVVSDIMMPRMNGIELAHKLKTDPRTAHIPVVLLTAMASEEMQLEGFQTGVQDYITKPFTFEILEARIHNLLNQEAQQKKHAQKGMPVTPAAIGVISADEQFLQKATCLVEQNLANPDFSVEELSRELFISRVALYKKLLSLTGKTPIEFIRLMRLKRGAQLLTQSGLTVAEVAYQVGFNNPKNFSRYFREEFGVLPSQWGAQEQSKS